MRTLIEEYDNKSGSMLITTTDLDGFWDMLLLQVYSVSLCLKYNFKYRKYHFQVEKLEGQFSQLAILKENNWTPLQPIAKKVLNKVPKVCTKRPDVKSKFADFIKSKSEYCH